ncbi:uncharacterized protein A4U43_C08F28600 [Asparagus officinalis]|nr:uncharacterized protein A4U43_C08F28600 [Asparagus officinalis]
MAEPSRTRCLPHESSRSHTAAAGRSCGSRPSAARRYDGLSSCMGTARLGREGLARRARPSVHCSTNQVWPAHPMPRALRPGPSGLPQASTQEWGQRRKSLGGCSPRPQQQEYAEVSDGGGLSDWQPGTASGVAEEDAMIPSWTSGDRAHFAGNAVRGGRLRSHWSRTRSGDDATTHVVADHHSTRLERAVWIPAPAGGSPTRAATDRRVADVPRRLGLGLGFGRCGGRPRVSNRSSRSCEARGAASAEEDEEEEAWDPLLAGWGGIGRAIFGRAAHCRGLKRIRPDSSPRSVTIQALGPLISDQREKEGFRER